MMPSNDKAPREIAGLDLGESNPYRVATMVDKQYKLSVVALGALAFLAIYGLARLLQDAGVILHRDGGSAFWFEDALRNWIHGN
jgi:hypothetical protein